MYEIRLNGQAYQLKREDQQLYLNNQPLQLDAVRLDAHRLHILLNNRSFTVEIVAREEKSMDVLVNGQRYALEISTELDLMLKKLGLNQLNEQKINELKAPMPGLVLRLVVESGQEVKKGDPLLVLESMKMENVLKSPGAGIVDKVLINTGNAVEKGQVLLRFR